jgi:hypothetical protein
VAAVLPIKHLGTNGGGWPAAVQTAERGRTGEMVEILRTGPALHDGSSHEEGLMARTAAVPRVGILVECGPEGLEIHLCSRICALLRDNHGAAFTELIQPMDNKERLLEEGATTAARLMDEGCERVVVLWDEEPAWPDMKAPPCWSKERGRVLKSLRGAGVAAGAVHLVCIERAFESWLLSDAAMLSRVLSRPTHKVRVKAAANPHTLRNVKGALMRIFRKHGQRYVRRHAHRRVRHRLFPVAWFRRTVNLNG